MENYHSAFIPGEYARIQRSRVVIEVQRKHAATQKPTLGLHTVMPLNMVDFAGQRVLIANRSYYHFGWVLYELEGLPGHWPEAALIDEQMGEDDLPYNQPAILTYVAVKSNDGEFVDIRSHAGQRFYSVRRHDLDATVDAINRVARIRTRSSFSGRYGFVGVELEEQRAVEANN